MSEVATVESSAQTATSSASNGLAVQAKRLRKSYNEGSDAVHALVGVDITIHQGEIVGVLGPNGAGKTTLISILEGLLKPDDGRVQVLGADVTTGKGLDQVKPRLGVTMQNSVLPPLLQVEELLRFKSAIYQHSLDADELLEALGLSAKRKAQYRHLSGGQQQRVVMAMALMGDPDLLFLDEPTSQLDPQARRAVWQLLADQRQRKNSAMLVTTHQMEEAERLCDRVLILDHGKVIAEGKPRDLVQRYCPERVVEFVSLDGAHVAGFEQVEISPVRADGRVNVKIRDAAVNDVLSELIRRQEQEQLPVDELRITTQTLEDVFLHLTGRGIRG